MNFEQRSELFQKRGVKALYAMMGLKKDIKRFVDEFVAGRETHLEGFRGVVARCKSKLMLRLALSDQAPISQVLETALTELNGQEDALRDFIQDLGVFLARGKKRTAFDQISTRILILWDGFDILPARNREQAAMFRTLPPLSRWNGRAAWQLIRTITRQPGLTYETYRKRVSRLRLDQVQPILVQKMKIDRCTFALTFTAPGVQWLRENHLLGAVTRNGKKMSHDTETLARFNAANGDSITVDRARKRRGRARQRTPANNSPDLHSIAAAKIALSLDRIQPKRAR
jgi:hypothetical protein